MEDGVMAMTRNGEGVQVVCVHHLQRFPINFVFTKQVAIPLQAVLVRASPTSSTFGLGGRIFGGRSGILKLTRGLWEADLLSRFVDPSLFTNSMAALVDDCDFVTR